MEIDVMNVIEYIKAKSICEKANAYWKANATFDRHGWSSLSAELAANPDYAECTNDLRGQVEQYEILKNPPDKLVVYVSSDGKAVTTWPGQVLGSCRIGHSWRQLGTRLYTIEAKIAGREYYGRGQGQGMSVVLTARKPRKSRKV